MQLLLALLATLAVNMAVGQDIPPDILGGAHQGTDILRQNMGQKLGTDGHPRNDVKAYFEGSPVGLYLRDSSRVSFTFTAVHNDSLTPDTAYRVDMAFVGAKYVIPDLIVPAQGVANYYRGGIAAEQVPAFHRGVYQEVTKDVDFHVYGSAGGPRMAFVVKPGGNPDNIKLAFTGQDSLNIDWMGSLKAYLNGKWVELKQAIAYQVNGDGSMSEVAWTPEWFLEGDSIYAKLTFGSYDHNLPLVLQVGYAALGGMDDPAPRNMEWSTFMGGSNADELTSVEVDGQGDPYLCGHTWSNDFPVNPGSEHFNPFIGELAGWESGVVMKFDHNNKRLEWATYYGGDVAATTGNFAKTEAHKLAVPKSNQDGVWSYVYVTGTTNCSDFMPWNQQGTPFGNAVHESYLNGFHRMWVGAFAKLNGIRDWTTTHGLLDGSPWAEEGLGIAFGRNGELAVGGRILRYDYASGSPAFDAVTPAGAWLQPDPGNGFIVLFNPDFTIRWSTPFGGFWSMVPNGQVTELCFTSTNGSTKLWATGATTGPGFPGTPGGSGYFQNASGTGTEAFLACFDVPTLHLDYATAWGGNGPSIGYGLASDEKDIWLVGGTESMDLSDLECPPPSNNGPGVHHTHLNAGTDLPFQSCDGFILAFNSENFALDYGTLFGGDQYDLFTDINPGHERMYITGETRSHQGFGDDLDADFYYQDLNNNVTSRDAVILALHSNANSPVLEWNTAYGGTFSERGWGIAASADEVYLTGTTSSNAWDAFPLMEYDTQDNLDYYQEFNLGGTEFTFMEFYEFAYGLDFEHPNFGKYQAEPLDQPQDGFVTCFNMNYSVGVQEGPDPEHTLGVTPLPAIGQWAVHLPYCDSWQITAFNGAGQRVAQWHPTSDQVVLDLGPKASGLYLLNAVDRSGRSYTGKLIRP